MDEHGYTAYPDPARTFAARLEVGGAEMVLVDRARLARLLAVVEAAFPGEIGPDGPDDFVWAARLGDELARLQPGDRDPLP